MKETVGIYLAGAMSGVSLIERWNWRKDVEDKTLEYLDDECKKPYFFYPCSYYDPDENEHKTEREAYEFDMYNLKRSDVVVANLNRQDSIGTIMEIAVAKDNGIPVIGLNESGKELHPWIIECCNRICDDIDEVARHVACFYLM